MTDNEILNKVKTTLFGTETGSFRDDLLRIYINEVKDFMKHAGVSNDVIMSEKSVGVIALGVNDLWNYQAGGVKLSQYFIQRVIQLTDESEETPTPTEKVIKQFTFDIFHTLNIHIYLFYLEPDSKITADGDCIHEIKRCLFLGRKVMTNLDSIFKSKETLLCQQRSI